ncbi:MAG: prepilin-type N-terminal cleavage/methylation domain-containing protein [Pirellulaceae bacterium]|nr:prepilin-type N-terminal cleavage/methylation domain-containing protein [Pirellulaceae bacterium]
MRLRRSAMTLLEVTIVMLILALLASVAVPRFSDTMRATQVRAAAIQVAAHIDYVRRIAINQSHLTVFLCNEERDQYGSPNVDFPNRIGTRLLVNVQETFDPSLQLVADFDGTDGVWFDIEGVPRVGAALMQDGSVTITAPGSMTYHVMVAAGTGKTTIMSQREWLVAQSDQAQGGGS